MCLLTYIPAGLCPDKKHLEQSCSSNPHGFGYAVISGNNIIIGKSMNPKMLIEEFIQVRKRYPNAPALFHSRFATSGELTTNNVHPFIVGKDKKTVIAHNGMLPVPTPVTDNRSDTAIFAEDILPLYLKRHKGGFDNKALMESLAEWSYGSKLVILTVNKNYKYNSYIINEKSGHYDTAGIWWSNYGYLPYTPTTKKAAAYNDIKVLPYQDSYQCFSCGESNSTNIDICTTCENCLWCEDYYLTCKCKYSPLDNYSHDDLLEFGGNYEF